MWTVSGRLSLRQHVRSFPAYSGIAGLIGAPQENISASHLPQVPLPRWGKLDHQSGWRDFADGVSSAGIADAVAAFQPQVPLCAAFTSRSTAGCGPALQGEGCRAGAPYPLAV